MTKKFEVITFDCYGTLIDWETGIAEAVRREAGRAGVRLEREAIVEAYQRKEATAEEAYRPYREILREVGREVADELKFSLPADREGFLVESLPSWQPFPDTNPSLERLAREGYVLGIVSNVDDDLLRETMKHFPVKFEIVVTAEQVRSYKPGKAHFVEARARIGERAWLHAAQSHFHDVAPARDLGIEVAWINRKGEEQKMVAVPDHQFPDLSALTRWLTGEEEGGEE